MKENRNILCVCCFKACHKPVAITGEVGTIAQSAVGQVDAISMIQVNNFGTPGPGDLNVVVRSGDKLKLFWQEDRDDHLWHGPYPLPGSGFG